MFIHDATRRLKPEVTLLFVLLSMASCGGGCSSFILGVFKWCFGKSRAVNGNTLFKCSNWQATVFLDACQFIRLDVCLLNCPRHGHKFLCNQHLNFRDKTLIKKVQLYHNFADSHD